MKPSFFAALFFIISILFLQQISFTDAQKAGEIENVCAQTEAPDLCISILKSDPRSINGGLKTLVIIALEKALSLADGLKDRCPDAYARLVNHIGEAIQRVQNDQIPMAILSVLAGLNDVASCYHTSLLTILRIALTLLRLLK
ncbi:PREDICTED: pectinesterase inhibitor-like [Ipomoea nil]|uniref:pectinesterase inhibitor-like n=1 Tax=Ipomoea nil TaxID=35883 RepID=UPI0009018B5C|nr:PREDICTED: pectinesterase inhibitor-like [Ipomoea nil]